MTFTDRIANWFGYTKAAVPKPPNWLSLTANAEQYNIPDRSLPEAQLELYQRLSWVQIAVGQVASMVATVPFGVSSMRGEDTDAVENHPFELLLNRPNPLMSRFEFMEATEAYYALTGNSYWWLNKASETGPRLTCISVKSSPNLATSQPIVTGLSPSSKSTDSAAIQAASLHTL